jgi:Kef-type K+ transport system membrane component KefB
MRKHALYYAVSLPLFAAGCFWSLRAGKELELARSNPGASPIAPAAPAASPAAAPSPRANTPAPDAGLFQSVETNLRSPLGLLFIQLIVVICAARLCGALATRFGQPAVIGEMIAGIALGPSLVGVFFPAASHYIFPHESLGVLRLLAQIGVVLFMFVVGMEMEASHLRNKAQTAVVVSHAGVVAPYLLGVILALALYRASSGRVAFMPFALFIGIAMSVTAFPVLARILDDRGMTKTPLGSMALACAAINDAAAWSILAFVVAIAQNGSLAARALSFALVIAFAAVTLLVVKPLLQRIPLSWIESGKRGKTLVAGPLIYVCSCALFTEAIGVHALFGAFLAGVAIPDKGGFREHLRERLESFSSVFLLPVFFAFTGLRTQIGLLSGWESWGLCLVVIAAATAGKMGGTIFAARWTGLPWGDSFSLGALMNTRGLVELIVLNIGFDMGILSPSVFAIMVAMALATTCMTGPLLTLGQAWSARKAAIDSTVPVRKTA